MLRRRLEINDGRRYLSPTLAMLCGLLAISLVLVAVVHGLRRSPGQTAFTLEALTDSRVFSAPGGIQIKHVDGDRWLFQRRDESDMEAYTREAVVRRLDQGRNQTASHTSVLLLIADGTPSGDILATLDELRAMGFRSFAVAKYESPAE